MAKKNTLFDYVLAGVAAAGIGVMIPLPERIPECQEDDSEYEYEYMEHYFGRSSGGVQPLQNAAEPAQNATETIQNPVPEQPYVPARAQDRLQLQIRDESSRTPQQNYRESFGRDIRGIVLHTTESRGQSALNTFQNPANQVSAHYVIMEDGGVIQVVDDEDIAYHCRGHNTNTIGIEIAGSYRVRMNDAQLAATCSLVQTLMERYDLSRESVQAHSILDSSRRLDPGRENMEAILGRLGE